MVIVLNPVVSIADKVVPATEVWKERDRDAAWNSRFFKMPKFAAAVSTSFQRPTYVYTHSRYCNFNVLH